MDAKIFITDYASYNNGSQFEFGHWVDLEDFTDAQDLMEYISTHFKECDLKSPLDSPREELMITDYEGFPEVLYSEAMSKDDLETIYAYIEILEDYGIDSLTDTNNVENLVTLWNEYCQDISLEDEIFSLDSDLEMVLGGDIEEAFKKGLNADINWSDDFLILNGWGNIESINNPLSEIDIDSLVEWLIEEKI